MLWRRHVLLRYLSQTVPEGPLHHERYPRSDNYDPAWVVENQMGPNALWLLESLTEVISLESGMRVLDLGCGRAMTSIFMAQEFGASVWATDLWIDPVQNTERIAAAGVEDLVTAVHAEAHALPFEEGFFDAVVSIDAYHYFGTDDLYLGYLVDHLRPGGEIGIVVPAVVEEFEDEVPEHLAPFWQWEYCCFHSPTWWSRHWNKTGMVTVETADMVEDGWKDWLDFTEYSLHSLSSERRPGAEDEISMLRADSGANLGFARVVASESRQ